LEVVSTLDRIDVGWTTHATARNGANRLGRRYWYRIGRHATNETSSSCEARIVIEAEEVISPETGNLIKIGWTSTAASCNRTNGFGRRRGVVGSATSKAGSTCKAGIVIDAEVVRSRTGYWVNIGWTASPPSINWAMRLELTEILGIGLAGKSKEQKCKEHHVLFVFLCS